MCIRDRDNARSYWKILMTNEYFELIKYIFSLTVRISNIALVYIFFYRDLMIFVSRYIPFPIEFIGIFVLISIFFVILHILVMFYRYSLIKKLQKYDDLAKINLEYQLLEQRLTLIYMISAMSLILLVLFLIGLPSHILLIFCCISFIFFIISIIELKRTTNVSFDYQKVDPRVISHPIKEHQGEQLAGSVFGVLKVATGLGDFLKPFSSSFLGTGKTYFPENTMFITNLRIILIQIPISGGNKVVGEVDYVTNNFFYNLSLIHISALWPAKRFFGAARNCQEGGSLTIIGTALVETGSRMDDLIYEEFKGTGNMELHLERKLAERRIYPAINIERSGTRQEHLLLSEDDYKKVVTMRRMMDMLNSDERTELFIEKLSETESNEEFLNNLGKT